MKMKYSTIIFILILGTTLGYMYSNNIGPFKNSSKNSDNMYLDNRFPSFNKKTPSQQKISSEKKEILYLAETRVSRKNDILKLARSHGMTVNHYSESTVGQVVLTAAVRQKNDLNLLKRDLINRIHAGKISWSRKQTKRQNGKSLEIYQINISY